MTEDDAQTEIEEANDELRQAVPEAAATVRDLLDADDERVQLRAAQAILDRAGVTEADRRSVKPAQRDVGGKEEQDELLLGGTVADVQ
jgi:vacuolar-type H+-ATPase subunit H